jgi:SAM-dependent methyltransferase
MYQMVMTYPEDYWITAIPYWLPAGSMASWKKDLHNLRETEGFYDPSWPDPVHSPGAIDYRNQNQERRETWESEVFWGMRMRLWRWMGGFREFEQWGSVDMDFLHRRGALKIPTIIAKSKDSPHEKNYLMVYHQNHESVRDMEKALEGIKGTVYPNEESARKAGGLYPIYNHGHRERATDGALGGILGDHIARYRWASFFTPGKIVVDIPCGTGYGSTFHRSVKAYYGMDIDAESIETADDFYGDDKHFFEVAGMTDIPLDDNSANIILCFEGLEHISYGDQVAFMLEMRRVLKPGGSFIISTPQHGAAPGTPWDRYMLDQPGLEALFTNPDYPWKKLDWFYQMSYGRDENPFMGRPPKDAQIMILGGSVVK